MEQKSSRLVLRLFGPRRDQVTQVLRAAADQGCPGLNLLMKNGEVLQLNRSYKNDFYKFISALRGGRENHAADH